MHLDFSDPARRAALDESLARQKLYTGVFIVGTGLATVASIYA